MSGSCPRPASAAIVLLLWSPFIVTASAQNRLTVDLGGAHVRYADTLSTSAISLSPTIRLESSRSALRLAGTFSQLGTGNWTMQGALDGALYSPSFGPLLAELGAAGGTSAHEDGNHTGQGSTLIRLHALNRRGGIWAGIGAGSTWDGFEWRRMRRADAGIWARLANGSLQASVSPNEVADSIRYLDTQLALHWPQPRWEVSATAGFRAGDRLPTLGGTEKSWGSIHLLVWFTRHVGVVASAGTYPVDFTQGFPGGRFLTLGLRMGWPPRILTGPAPLSAGENGNESADAARFVAFEATAATDGFYTFRVQAPSAGKVEIAADFTAWQPVAFGPQEKGWWTIKLPVSTGVHQLNVRLDGGAWLVPPGLAAMRDEFGGNVGLLIVK